jgi:hypothetical protein
MALRTKTYTLDAGAEPHIDSELGIRLARGPVNDRTLLSLHPHGNNEPKYRRFVVGILALTRENAGYLDTIKGQGQIVLTGHRILGLVTDGMHNAEALSEATGRVAGFSFSRKDIASADFPTNWRGSPKRVIIGMSSTNSRPLDIALDIQVVVVAIANGKTMPSTVKAFAEALDDKAAAALL